MPFTVDLWKIQNLYWDMLKANFPAFIQKAQKGDQSAAEWIKDFSSLGEQLKIRVG
jgi:hypothetical protein